VAIAGALMIGLGFRPLDAAKAALIGNTVPVAYGSVGIPIITLAKVTGLDPDALSAMVGRQLPFLALLVPFWLVAAQAGWRGIAGVWPACLVAGVSFAGGQFLVSNFQGPYLVDAAAGLSSIGALVILLRFWKPREVQTHTGNVQSAPNPAAQATMSRGRENIRAWLPWVLLTVFVTASSLTPVKNALNQAFSPILSVPSLHMAVQKVAPAVPRPEAEAAQFTFNLLSTTGTWLLVAGVIAGFLLGLKPLQLLATYGRTLKRVRLSLLTVALMLALGFTTRYSGSDTTMGLALTSTGILFPFFSPLLGWLGVAVTGSNTSSNVLFGNLQKVTAQQLDLSPILTAASNSSGGVMGKIINAQSIVVAGAAIGGRQDSPDAGTILRAVFWHSIALGILMGILVMLQAYVFQWMIVVPPS
jgi:lactate permease